MKTPFRLSLWIASFPLLIWAKAPLPELTQGFWNDPAFVRGFMGDYGFRSEVEPRIDKAEQFILREVVAKAENQLEEAVFIPRNQDRKQIQCCPRFRTRHDVLSVGQAH